MSKSTELDPTVLEAWIVESPAGKVYNELKKIAAEKGVDLHPEVDSRGHIGSSFYYNDKLISFGTRVGGREVGDYDAGIASHSVRLEDIIRVPELAQAIEKTGMKYDISDIAHLEYCLEGILGSAANFSPVDLMLEMGLNDLDKINILLDTIIADLETYCGQDYKISCSNHNLSILLQPLNTQAKTDMINHGPQITNLMNKINAYFGDKTALKAKITEAITTQKKERDSIQEEQLKELELLRTML
ncbi:MAG: hypothetical protein WCO66_00430 [Candidatus Absconditabacteria bacterium]